MRRKLKITGTADGYYLSVAGTTLYASGRIARRMDGTTGLTWGGTYLPPAGDRDEVEAAIAAVMAGGTERTVTITVGVADRPRPAAAAAPAWRSRRGLTLTEEMDRDDTDF